MKHNRLFSILTVFAIILGISHAPAEMTSASSDILIRDWDVDTSTLCGADTCFAINFTFDGTAADFLGYDPSVSHNRINATPVTKQGSSSHYRDALDSYGQGLYDAIDTAVTGFLNSAAWSGDLSSGTAEIKLVAPTNGHTYSVNEIKAVCRSFLCDNVQYYWIKNGFGYGNVESSLGLVFYVDPYYYTKSVRNSAESSINTLSSSWISELSSIKSSGGENGSYLAALRLHDLIIARINYAYASSGVPEDSVWAHSIAGVFTAQGVVCEGYAKVFSYILNRLEIDNYYIEGTAHGGGHAWNALGIGGAFYLCDVTWDDPNPSSQSDLNDSDYTYFCMPSSLFAADHSPESFAVKALPALSNTPDKTFYSMFCSFSASPLTSQTASTLADSAYGHKYDHADYLHFMVPDTSSIQLLAGALDISGGISYRKTPLGYLFKVLSISVTNPALSVTLSKTTAEAERGEAVTLTATVPAGSDDRIVWSIDEPTLATLRTAGKTCTVTGSRNATVTVTATTYKGKATVSCTIKIGTGVAGSDVVIWANGGKNFKTGTIKPTITATNWKNARGTTVKGKLVWLVEPEKTTIEFDAIKHSVTTKTNSKSAASVTTKGVVTAKSTGTAYIYVCDTGSLTYEEFEVIVLGAPTKLTLSKKPGSTERSDLASRVSIEAGTSVRVYIVPTLTKGTYEPSNTYTAALDKAAYSSFISVSDVMKDENNNPYFTISALKLDEAKLRNASARINIVNTQSGKKTSCSVTIGNPVTDITTTVTKVGSSSVAPGEIPVLTSALKQRNSTVTLKLAYTTRLGSNTKSADQIKLVVGLTSVTLDGTRVTNDRGSAIRATLDKKTMTVTLKMTAKECTTGVVYAVMTNSLDRSLKLIPLCTVNADGTVILSP